MTKLFWRAFAKGTRARSTNCSGMYQGKIFNLAMSILKNESDREEAAQTCS